MILAPQDLPLAGFMDFIQAIIPLIVMVMWAVSQLAGNKHKQRPPARQRPVPPANPAAPVAQAGQGAKPPTLEETLRREVEEFMRRAQGGKAAGREPEGRKPAPQQRPTAKPQRPNARPPRDAQSSRPMPDRADQPVRRLTDAPGAQTTATSPASPHSAPTGAAVSQHVAQHLSGAQALAAHAQHLGADVAQADERLVAHLQQKFTHQLGALEQQAATQQLPKASRSPAAQALVNLMAQPGGVRQVVIASEIFRRPEERWSRQEASRAARRATTVFRSVWHAQVLAGRD